MEFKVPPIKSVRLPGGRERFTSARPEKLSGKRYDRAVVTTEGASPSRGAIDPVSVLSSWHARAEYEGEGGSMMCLIDPELLDSIGNYRQEDRIRASSTRSRELIKFI